MFEAKFVDGSLLRHIIESIRELVTEVNLECTSDGITIQSMDSSHVSFVSMVLKRNAFEFLRCDRSLMLGFNISSFSKILRSAGSNDVITMQAEDEPEYCSITFTSPGRETVSKFKIRLMNIESEPLAIPDRENHVELTMPSELFQKHIRNLSKFGDTLQIIANQKTVVFSTVGQDAKANITFTECSAGMELDQDDDEDHKNELAGSLDEDDQDDCDSNLAKKRKKSSKVNGVKRTSVPISIEASQNVELLFPLKFVQIFTKATPLSESVKISLIEDVPLQVEYEISGMGYIKFYLAPKIATEEDS